MSEIKDKNYFSIEGYGTLLLPISLLEKVLSEAVLVDTGYDSDTHRDTIREVKKLHKFQTWDKVDIQTAIAEKNLSS